MDHRPFDRRLIISGEHSMWRYRSFLPIQDEPAVTLSEGATPLLPFARESKNLVVKAEYSNPTGSFKDRGSSVLLTWAHAVMRDAGLSRVNEDSSGNAGASIAAYCARAAVDCDIFVPERVSEAKAKQIEFYGANIHKVRGPRDRLSEAAQNIGRDGLYAGHVWNPHFTEAMKTVAFEIAEELAWYAPDVIFAPTSAGTLLLGVIRGFQQLASCDIIPTMPKIVAVQTEQVSPVYHAFRGEEYKPPSEVTSIADALISTKPLRLREMVQDLKDCKGDVEIVSEEQTIEARRELAAKGFFVEPSSATAFAAHKKWTANKGLGSDSRACLILTGTGLKSS